VRDSYLWDGTIVEEGCVIDQSIIGRSATVLKGSMIDRGCIVGDRVKLGPQARLPEFSRVAQEEPEEGGGKWPRTSPAYCRFDYFHRAINGCSGNRV
jgi:translation initiation factor eIF-2B subunit epsilon